MAGKGNKKQDVQATGISWIKQLAESISTQFPPQNDGWMTMREVMQELNLKESTCRKVLERNNATRKKFRYIDEYGKHSSVWYYKIENL